MSARDPIPAELRAKIKRLRAAMWAAGTATTSGPAYWRANAEAKRDLADAYAMAAQLAPDDSLLHAAMSDAARNLQDVAHYHEEHAAEESARRAAAGGQA